MLDMKRHKNGFSFLVTFGVFCGHFFPTFFRENPFSSVSSVALFSKHWRDA